VNNLQPTFQVKLAALVERCESMADFSGLCVSTKALWPTFLLRPISCSPISEAVEGCSNVDFRVVG
jgi:hypothetical protein